MNRKILIIHGPNLNLLGDREPDIYGKFSLSDINKNLNKIAEQKKVELEIFQSNHEGEIIDTIHNKRNWANVIIINPAGYTHTSVVIRDALLSVKIPVIEVHLSNIFKREKFRHKSLISDIAQGIISGFGDKSYYAALNLACEINL